MLRNMTSQSQDPPAQNYYDDQLACKVGEGNTLSAAVEFVANSYLDGKPAAVSGRRTIRKDRDSRFWPSSAVKACPPETWNSEAMVLALSRYLGQDEVAAQGLLTRVAQEAPDALIRAVRYSGFVLDQPAQRRAELDASAATKTEIAELCRVLDVFNLAHRQRLAAVNTLKTELGSLSAFDLLIYASLYGFEKLVPRNLGTAMPAPAEVNSLQMAWDAIADLLAWKLGSAELSSLKLTGDRIGVSISRHLRPILFESGTAKSSEAMHQLATVHALLEAQIELNEFIGRSADAFSYDDGIRFERHGDRLEIVEVDPAASVAWRRDARKLDRLHGYWFHRALDEFVAYTAVDPTLLAMGRPENVEANQMAWMHALQAQLRLREVYGIADTVTSESGKAVDIFKALLSLNLMSAFFQGDFLAAYAERLAGSGDWLAALQRLAFDGLRDNMQNRLPLTWSDSDAKVRNITGWMVTASEPKGNPGMAAAILDFWSSDMGEMAARLQRQEPGLQPDLFERPVLKFGTTLVQLPWIVGMQNNSAAAINNLRRLGARRGQAREETQRIETGLAKLLELRGFKTLLNWNPPRDEVDPGEVDVIAVSGEHLFVLEVKSTFLRHSQRDAWIHATSTLRKAGQQVRRKMTAVLKAITTDSRLREQLGLADAQTLTHHHGWIVDTSIECDHQRFAGYLKISIEEMLIALRDDSHLLRDPEGLLAGRYDGWSLYPSGFNVERFVEVIETEAVWDEMDVSSPFQTRPSR